VHAKRGKLLRAEPVAAYYEQGRVRHVGNLTKLEQQMLTFTGATGEQSPDRLDAAVYAIGELITGNAQHAFW
jgi:phage terminase large subunit-like protein